MQRSPGGIRQYSEEDLEALELICCLKNTGMPLREIARFADLSRRGEHTLEERVELLGRHRDLVIGRMNEIRKHLDQVTRKLEYFSGRLEEYGT